LFADASIGLYLNLERRLAFKFHYAPFPVHSDYNNNEVWKFMIGVRPHSGRFQAVLLTEDEALKRHSKFPNLLTAAVLTELQMRRQMAKR
jgi:hypothetical protein